MKKINKTLVGVVSLFCLTACTDLDVPPLNIVNDKQILGSEGGVKSYMARVYGEMPIEDFRYSPEYLYNHFWVLRVPAGLTGGTHRRGSVPRMERRRDGKHCGEQHKHLRQSVQTDT